MAATPSCALQRGHLIRLHHISADMHPDHHLESAARRARAILRHLACGLAAIVCAQALAASAAPAPDASDGALPEFQVRNLGKAQSDIPFTFGQVFAPGQFGKNDNLATRGADGALLRLQTDVKATHADGSVRHAVISGILPRLAANRSDTLRMVKTGHSASKSSATPRALIERGLTAGVKVTIDGVTYSASLGDALMMRPAVWLAGPVVQEWRAAAPLRSAAGAPHPLLAVSFAVRWYPELDQQARVEVVLENTRTFQAGMRNLSYDVEIEVGGRTVARHQNLLHYHHARWRQLAWWNPARAPDVQLRHDMAYLIASRAVPNYDQDIVPAESALAALSKRMDKKADGPMTIGPVMAYMGTAGGRPDIGPLPAWSVMYLLSQDLRAQNAMLAAAEGSGSWSVHYRDEKTGYPLRTDSAANRRISTHMNLAHAGPLPVPRCAGGDGKLCKNPNSSDTAHQPSLAYLPYLLSGDYYYLEELQFWAAANPLATDPSNSGLGQGLVRWQQLRGQAWSLRTLGEVAYITPDDHPLKGYFSKQLDNNLSYYHQIFVTAKPNRLGVYDGSGEKAFRINQSAPWQDDFLTWSFGRLVELGFTKALPILRWKATYPVGRMTAPGYCWVQGAAYTLKIRDTPKSPVYASFVALYQANFGGATVRIDDGKKATHPNGSLYIDQPCASPQQADWLAAALGRGWQPGRMSGYADSALGYPSNMQPALAMAVDAGTPNAAEAWRRFQARTVQPDYSKSPQWAIIPR